MVNKNTNVRSVKKDKQMFAMFVWTLSVSAGRPAANLAGNVFESFGLATLSQRVTSVQGTARSLSAAFRIRREYLYSFRECTTLLSKISIRTYTTTPQSNQ